MTVAYPNNVTQRAKHSRLDRRKILKMKKMSRGAQIWKHEDSQLHEVTENQKIVLKNEDKIDIVQSFKYLGQVFSFNYEK